MVYLLRAEVDPVLLRNGSPRDLVKEAIDKGLVGEQGINNTELGKVTVVGDAASGEMISKGWLLTAKYGRTKAAELRKPLDG